MLILLIRLYQRTLSRWTPTCPQDESCSEYAIRAIREHGAGPGLTLAASRLEHCR